MNKEKLLELADLLEAVSQYRQDTFFGARSTEELWCGTPACALGHWALAHPDTWEVLEKPWVLIPNRIGATADDIWHGAGEEFDLTEDEADILFEADGCGKAKTGKQAAEFIRGFVAGHYEYYFDSYGDYQDWVDAQ